MGHVGLFLRHRNGWLVSSIAHAWVYPSAFLRTVQTIIQVFHTRTSQLKKRTTPQSMETLSVKKPPRCLVFNNIRLIAKRDQIHLLWALLGKAQQVSCRLWNESYSFS